MCHFRHFYLPLSNLGTARRSTATFEKHGKFAGLVQVAKMKFACEVAGLYEANNEL